MRPCMSASPETSATDSKVAAAIAVASNTLANADTALDGGRTDGDGLYQRRLRLSTAKDSAKAGAMNHGNSSPTHVFRCTIAATMTSVPTPTKRHHGIEPAITFARTALLDAGPGP